MSLPKTSSSKNQSAPSELISSHSAKAESPSEQAQSPSAKAKGPSEQASRGFKTLLTEALHRYHETDLSLEYDCETLASDIEEYFNDRVIVNLRDFSHGYPWGFNCTFPTCTINGHKPPIREVHIPWGNEGYCSCGLFRCPILREKLEAQLALMEK